MGRGAFGTEVVATVAVALVLALAGCAGGSSPPPPGPPHSLDELRSQIRELMDSRLTEFGASPSQIACVDRAIETSSATEIGHRILQGRVGPGERKHTPERAAGSLGKGCF